MNVLIYITLNGSFLRRKVIDIIQIRHRFFAFSGIVWEDQEVGPQPFHNFSDSSKIAFQG